MFQVNRYLFVLKPILDCQLTQKEKKCFLHKIGMITHNIFKLFYQNRNINKNSKVKQLLRNI